jgi:hypothetical protein
LFAVISTQIGFFGHEAARRQISRRGPAGLTLHVAVLRHLNAVGADLRRNRNPKDPHDQVHAPASRKRTVG